MEEATTEACEDFVGGSEEGTDAVVVELVDANASADQDEGPQQAGEEHSRPRTSKRYLAEHEDERSDNASAMESLMLSPSERYARWQFRRPVTSHLKDAVVDVPGHGRLPLFNAGDRVVVEQRVAGHLGPPQPDPTDPVGTVRHPWIRTVVGTVTSIDDEKGTFRLYDENEGHSWRRHCFSFRDELTTTYSAPRVGDPFDVSAIRAAERAAQRAAEQQQRGQGRGRGRPAGSKNRPKEEIKAEKDAYKAHRAEKTARRNARLGIVAR